MTENPSSGDGWTLLWIDAILMVPAIFGVMFLGMLPFIVMAVVTAAVIVWLLYTGGARAS